MILFLAFIAVYVSTPAFLNSFNNQSLSQSPVILLVGDFTNDEAFGTLVYRGANDAQQNNPRKDYPQIEIHKIEVNDSAWEDSFAGSNTAELQAELNSLHEKFLRYIVTNNVVAIISANTSQNVPTDIEV